MVRVTPVLYWECFFRKPPCSAFVIWAASRCFTDAGIQEINPVIFLQNQHCKLDCIPVFQLSGECRKKIFIALALPDQGEGWLFKDALLMNARGHLPLLTYKWLVTEKCREINSQVLCLLWLFSRCVTLDMGYL